MKNFKIALQLYSIRDEMEKDMDAALKAVKEMGYDFVEFAGYFGRSAQEVKELLDKHGLKCHSVHQAIGIFEKEGQSAIDFLKTIGAKYCAIPWYDVNELKGTEKWPETSELFNKVGKALKENGIQMLYHNHDFEFNKFEGKFLLDWMFEEIPAEYLQPQIDTCWVHYAGYNPSEYILKYSGRVSVVHLKDFVCKNLGSGPVYGLIDEAGTEKRTSREDNGFEYKPLGLGIQNIPDILKAAEKAGAEYLVVEQDESLDLPTLEAAKISRDYLKSLGL
ncbi:MAG: sugar phosphate isomerase/epimerase [Eubacteriales bacterium]|jgi:sugar phosphate isomerase/epimerase|nr:sugar phosphate isomerase/epimerase [Eubacteriales bacterium]